MVHRTEAERIAAVIVPKLNSMGGSKAAVREALQQVEAGGGPEAFLHSTIRSASDVVGRRRPTSRAASPRCRQLRAWQSRWRCTKSASGARWMLNCRSWKSLASGRRNRRHL